MKSYMEMKVKMKLMMGAAAVPLHLHLHLHPKFHLIHLLLRENDSGMIWMKFPAAQPIRTLLRNLMLFRSVHGGRHIGISYFMNPENFGLRNLKHGG
jgi:hypothetical protein